MLNISYNKAYTCDDYTPDYIEDNYQHKCAKTGNWSSEVAYCAELNEYFSLEEIEKKDEFREWITRQLQDATEDEIDELINNLKI